MNVVAFVVPNWTAVAPVRLVPAIVMLVPPLAGPDVGLTCVTAGAGGSTMTFPLAVAPDPPTSLIDTEVLRFSAVAYVWVPLTTNPPLGPAATVPVERAVPSPQLIVAVKSDACASEFASVNVATEPLNCDAATAVKLTPLAVSGASVTLISNGVCPGW